MQNDTTEITTDIATEPVTVTDPRPHLRAAADIAVRVAEGVTQAHLRLPTPCAEFDVEQLLAHLAFALSRAGEAGRGESITEPGAPITSTDWPRDLRVLADQAAAAWDDAARLDATIALPWATLTGAQTVAVYVNELIVHSWDLATATGQHVEWDDDIVALAHAAILGQLPVGDRDPMWAQFLALNPHFIEFAPPFANAQPVADDASPIERLVAWNGRALPV